MGGHPRGTPQGGAWPFLGRGEAAPYDDRPVPFRKWPSGIYALNELTGTLSASYLRSPLPDAPAGGGSRRFPNRYAKLADMSTPYEGLEPHEVWRHFAALNSIPRPSGHEGAARAYVQEIAVSTGAGFAEDEAGNTVVRVPARGAGAHSPTVAVQTHLDMVSEAEPGVHQNFLTDPIVPRRDGDSIYATGTTLGADNGIGVAAALALLTQPPEKHGPLELVFTVGEEVGLLGALALDVTLISARSLLNLDSEDPESFTIGSAGATDFVVTLPATFEPTPATFVGRSIVVEGLRGGHSGVQIHEHLANALRLLYDLLTGIDDLGIRSSLCWLSGGSSRNAIPRSATADLVIDAADLTAFDTAFAKVREKAMARWRATEPGLAVRLSEIDPPAQMLVAEPAARWLCLLGELPHGVLSMSPTFPGTVETSCNLAITSLDSGLIKIQLNARSLRPEGLAVARERIESLSAGAGAGLETAGGYAPWSPELGSALVEHASRAFRDLFGHDPRIEVIHAGLECGVISGKIPGMHAVSFGPRIEAPHTPDEHVSIPTVAATWELLKGLLARLAGQDALPPTQT